MTTLPFLFGLAEAVMSITLLAVLKLAQKPQPAVPQRIRVEFGNERLEECDGCHEIVPIRIIQLSGKQFLCPKCGDLTMTHPQPKETP